MHSNFTFFLSSSTSGWKSNVYSSPKKGIPFKLKDIKFPGIPKQNVKGYAPYLAKQKNY